MGEILYGSDVCQVWVAGAAFGGKKIGMKLVLGAESLRDEAKPATRLHASDVGLLCALQDLGFISSIL
jgi:hypothetical protein